MRVKVLVFVFSLVPLGFLSLAQAACDPADQIAPNPNPDGATLTVPSGTACNALDPYENLGTLNNEGTLVNEGFLANGVSGDSGTLNNNGTLINSVGATVDNSGVLNNEGLLSNDGDFPIRERKIASTYRQLC